VWKHPNQRGFGRAPRSPIASPALLCWAVVLVAFGTAPRWRTRPSRHHAADAVRRLAAVCARAPVRVGHHVALGLISPLLVFDHPGSPWLWALVHDGFVLALAAANMAVWRSTDLLQHDVDVSWWVTPDAYHGGYYARLYAALRHWIADAFPFRSPHFSNREIPR
jgi:hypothetical protein